MLLIPVKVHRAVELKKRNWREKKKQKDRPKIYSMKLIYRQGKKELI